MVGIAERGRGYKCPDNVMPEKFLLDYVIELESPPDAPPLPEEVKAMVQALRNEFATSKRACEAADMIERLAAIRNKNFE